MIQSEKIAFHTLTTWLNQHDLHNSYFITILNALCLAFFMHTYFAIGFAYIYFPFGDASLRCVPPRHVQIKCIEWKNMKSCCLLASIRCTLFFSVSILLNLIFRSLSPWISRNDAYKAISTIMKSTEEVCTAQKHTQYYSQWDANKCIKTSKNAYKGKSTEFWNLQREKYLEESKEYCLFAHLDSFS